MEREQATQLLGRVPVSLGLCVVCCASCLFNGNAATPMHVGFLPTHELRAAD